MKQSRILVVGAALILGSLTTPSHAATMILHNFAGGTSDGQRPYGALTLSGSKLYGMTVDGGSSSNGTVFSMNTDGTSFALLHRFTGGTSDGRDPLGSLTLSGSKLYGMTYKGGGSDQGTVFSINTDGTGFSLLHSFTSGIGDGGLPEGSSLTLGGSKLYGMTSAGGSNNAGAIFSINTDGTGFSLLHSFPFDIYGSIIRGDLTLAGSKLYGMMDTITGGGSIFSINTDGTDFSLLHSFAGGSSDGSDPLGSLTLSGSTLYGMTPYGGGPTSGGTVFSINTDGSGFSLLHSFADGSSDGDIPVGSLTLSGSTLYGMTNHGGSPGDGTIFGIGVDGTGFRLIAAFDGPPTDGINPTGSPAVSVDGSMLYGMTHLGGTANSGTVFSKSTTGAVPEPGAAVSLGLGALLLSARRRNGRA